jgi:hypothetical protein
LIALIVAGLFLVPPTAVFGSSDTLVVAKKADASVPSPPVISDPAVYGTPSPVKGDSRAPSKIIAVPQGPFSRDQFTLPQNKASGGRGPRAGPDAELIGLEVVWPTKVDQWVWAGVMALKGADTQFNVTVNNSGTDPTTGAINVVFAIQDYFGKDMVNLTQDIASLGSGQNQTLYFHWTPAYCTYFRIVIITTTPGDANVNNDFSRFVANGNNGLLAVALWADPCADMSSFTGGPGDTGVDRNWHISTNPKNDNSSQHSTDGVLYQGKDGLVRDEYENNKNIAVHTPNFDFRKFGSSYFLHLSYLFRGAFPAADLGDYFEQQFSSDSGANWGDGRVKVDGSMLPPNPQTSANYYNWFTDINNNKQMDINEVGLEISGDVVGKTAMFRDHFVSNSAITDIGLYTDDYIIWGMEIQNDIGIEMTNDLGTPVLGDTVVVNATVTNTGSNPQPAAFNATLNITHRGDPLHMMPGFPMLQQINVLAVGASQTVSFSWNPAETGDYVLVVNITGAKDENPNNNADARWMRVSDANPQILVVDDNPWGSPFNTTDKITDRLAEVGFPNYARWYWSTGGDGPSAALMKKFDIVIWLTGIDNNVISPPNGTLTANDQANLKSYLNAGGTLWLASMELINDLGPNNTFVKNTLHVSKAMNNTEIKGDELGLNAKNQAIIPNPLIGEPNSLADGIVAFTSMPPGRNFTFDWTDLIWSDGQSSGVFWGNDSQTDDPLGPHVAIQYAGAYRLVFQSFDPTFLGFLPNLTLYVSSVVGFLMGGLSSEVGVGGIPNNHQMVDPGGQAVYTMTISNGGTKTRTLWNLDITQPPTGWTAALDPSIKNGDSPVDIAPGDSVDVKLTVTAPQKALAGATAPIDITASFKSYTPTLKNSTLTEVRAILGTKLSATITVQNLTGPGVASYSFTLSNLGNLQVTAELTKTGDNTEWLSLGSPTVSLQPYEERLLSAVITVPDGAFRQAGNYTLKDMLTARVTYQGSIATANLTLTTNIRIAQIFSVKIDEALLDPADGQADMSLAKPSVKLTVSVTAAAANGNDTASIELRAKSFTPMTGSSRAWDGSGWTLPKTTIDTTPFMVSSRSGQLTVLVNPKADPGDYVIEVRAIPGSGRLTDGDTTQITIKVARPDLQLLDGSLVFNPREPQVGTPVTIKVTVKNAGGVAAKNVDVTFYDSAGNQIGDTQRIDDLPALTGTRTVQITWDGVVEGENRIDVKADPNNVIPESDETNNEINNNDAPLIGYRSDVVIDAPPVFLKNNIAKTSVTDGDTVVIEVDVKNEGTWGLNLTGVTVTMTDQTTGDTQTQSISINTRSDTKVDFTWAAHKVGTHTFSIKATPDASINEKSATNNEQTATLKVNAQPTNAAGFGGAMLYAIIGVVVIVVIVALAMVMMRRKPAATAAAPAEERVDVVEAETVEVEGERK